MPWVISYLMFGGAGLLLTACQGSPTAGHLSAATASPAAPAGCSQGLSDARRDFERGQYELHSVEFVPARSSYVDVLASRYRIGWRFVASDAPGTYYGCYDSLMLVQLQTHYGSAFLTRARQLADSLDATGTWYAEASFPGGSAAMLPFVYTHLDWHRAPVLQDTLRQPTAVFVTFRLDETGWVQQPRILKGLDEAHNREVLRVVQLMPRWRPAYERGRPVATEWTVPVRFTQTMRTRYGH